MNQLIDPRPMDPPEYWDDYYEDPRIEWVINYHEYDKEQKRIVPRTERGHCITDFLDTVMYNLHERIECDGYINAANSAPPVDVDYGAMYTAQPKCPEHTCMHWRIYDPGDEKNFDKHEEGTDNHDLLFCLEKCINERQEFKFDISEHDPSD